MKHKPLQHDLFLYEFAIRMLGVLATLLFSLLFFYGIAASENTEEASVKENKTSTAQTTVVKATNEYASLGDMH